MKIQDLGQMKKLALGTVAIQLKAFPFTNVMVVSAADFAQFGLQDTDTYQAKRLVKDQSDSTCIHRTWTYIR